MIIKEEFETAIKIIEKGLAERDREKIGLRWPLAKATVYSDDKIGNGVEKLISRQLNVKKIDMKKGNEIAVKLDTKMTPELEAEGFARELARKVQAERKNAGLQKGEMIKLTVYSDDKFRKIIQSQINFLKERTNSKEIKFSGEDNPKADSFSLKEHKIRIDFSLA